MVARPTTIAVAGASGFVGKALLAVLAEKYDVIALTRATDLKPAKPNVTWRRCDLFSLLDAEQALVGADVVIYLVHSMLPASELTQASFEDLDLVVADNVARAAAANGVSHIIYLGGIIPAHEALSSHLRSRQEVEAVLASRGTPLTTLRAGMIVGPDGSSLEMLLRLVEKLPLMACPRWTKTLAEPVALTDVLRAIDQVVLEPQHYGKCYDLCGADQLSYQAMMRTAAKLLGRPLLMIQVPFVTPTLSRLWVSCITSAPKNLVAPLIQSLKHEMTSSKEKRFIWDGEPPLSFETALGDALAIRREQPSRPRAFTLPKEERKRRTAQSVQRIYRPTQQRAREIAELYPRWLQTVMPFALRTTSNNRTTEICLRGVGWPLLRLELSERSSEDRRLFYIRGGLLARPNERGRLEFRESYESNRMIVALHDFEPALPWWLYRFTQAPLHAWIMRRFDRYLQSYNPGADA
jgi:uncharacterized protein YbjT (DUF2867 family)